MYNKVQSVSQVCFDNNSNMSSLVMEASSLSLILCVGVSGCVCQRGSGGRGGKEWEVLTQHSMLSTAFLMALFSSQCSSDHGDSKGEGEAALPRAADGSWGSDSGLYVTTEKCLYAQLHWNKYFQITIKDYSRGFLSVKKSCSFHSFHFLKWDSM